METLLNTKIKLLKDGSYKALDRLVITYHPIFGWSVTHPEKWSANCMDLEDTIDLLLNK